MAYIHKSLITTLFLICLLFSFSNVSGSGWGEFSAKDWNQTATEKYPEANSIIIFDSMYVGMLKEDVTSHYVKKERHVRFKVLTKEGIDEVSNVEFGYHKSTDVVDIKAHTIKPDGTIYEIDKDNFLIKKINDFRYTSFAFTSVDVGDILEYTYTLHSSGYMGDYKWYFHSEIYTLKSIISFEVIPGCEYTFATSNVPDIDKIPSQRKSKRVQMGTTTTYTWKMKDLIPVKYEPYMGSINDYNANLMIQLKQLKGSYFRVSGTSDWKSHGAGVHRYIRGYTKTPRGFGKLVNSITSGYDTKYEKSKAIYKYVIENIQTRQEDYGLYFEHESMDKLFKEKHGRACEKNILMIEMFNKARIKAWPVLISTRDHGKVDPTVYREDQFNHLIVFAEVEEGGIYLDATSTFCPYGLLAPQCRSEIGLIVDDNKSELLQIITSQPKSIRIDLSKIHINESGQAVCSLQSRLSGYMAVETGREYEITDEDSFIENELLGNVSESFEVDSFSCKLDESNNFAIDAVITFNDLIERFNENLSFPSLSFLFSNNPFDAENRQFPINFNYPFTYHNVVYLTIDGEVNNYTVPEEKNFYMDGLTYIRKVTRTDLGFNIESKLEISKPQFTVSEYPILQESFNRISSCSSEQIIMKIN